MTHARARYASTVESAVDVVSVIGLAVLCAIAFLWDVVLINVMISLHNNDFGKFYFSTRSFLAGENMYAPNPATDLGVGKAAGLQFLNMNPPHFHALLVPLAILPPAQAVSIWMVGSVFALVLAILLILRELQIEITAKRLLMMTLACLVMAPSQTFFITGQLSLLLTLPLTLAWLDARHDRWGRVGGWLGACLSVKPFLLIFIPYLLIAHRRRALVVGMRVVACCYGLGLLVFGVGNYRSWVRALAMSNDWAWASMNGSILSFFQRVFEPTPYFAPLWVQPSLVWLYMVCAGMVGIATLLVVSKDRNRLGIDRSFGLLLVASQLISPLGWVYYLWLAAGPMAAVAIRRRRNLSPVDVVLLSVVVAGLLVPPTALFAFQPSGWATLVVGCSYFWVMFALWILLLFDCPDGSLRNYRGDDLINLAAS